MKNRISRVSRPISKPAVRSLIAACALIVAAACTPFEVPDGVIDQTVSMCEQEVALISGDARMVEEISPADSMRASGADEAMSQAKAAQREQQKPRTDESEWPPQVLFNRCLRRNGVVLPTSSEKELEYWRGQSQKAPVNDE